MEQRLDGSGSNSGSDEMKLTVRLCIYDTPQGVADESPDVTDFDAWISKRGTVAELKAVLESQDLIPEDSDQFTIEVRVDPTSAPLPDTFSLPEETTEVLLSVRPMASASSSTTAVGMPVVTLPPPPSRPANDWSALLASTGLLASMPGSTAAAQRHPAVRNELPTSAAAQMEAAQNLIATADPNAIRQLMNSPFMRAMMANPELLRTIIDSNPQMRELRERNPELNYILNDPQLLRESMEAMQNPSLMREMISNTDRVLRNIDAVPGGFNALRNVYESIQEPMWAAATASSTSTTGGGQRGGEGRTKTYDLQTDKEPSTEAIPNPWATVRPPSPPAPRRPTILRPPVRPTSAGPKSSPRPPPRPSSSSNHNSGSLNKRHDCNNNAGCSSSPLTGPAAAPPSPVPLRTSEILSPEVNTPQLQPPQPTPSSIGTASQQPTFADLRPSPPPSSASRPSPLPAAGQYPYLYQSVFPSQHRLRSLGGLGLPHGAHIRGVIRPSQEPQQRASRPEQSSSSSSSDEDDDDERLVADPSSAQKKSHKHREPRS